MLAFSGVILQTQNQLEESTQITQKLTSRMDKSMETESLQLTS